MRILIILILLTFGLFNAFVEPVTVDVTFTVENVEKVYAITVSDEVAGIMQRRAKLGLVNYYDWQTGKIAFQAEYGFPSIKTYEINAIHGLHPFFANFAAMLISVFFIFVYCTVKSVDKE